MKLMSIRLFFILFVLTSAACSVGPFEEPEDPSVPEGPGILTGETGEFSVSDFVAGKDKKEGSGGYSIYDLSGAPPMTEEQFKEFEQYRAWLRSQQKGTDEYKEFQEWKAYQRYKSSVK